MALKIIFGRLAMEYIAEEGRLVQDVAEEIGKTPASQFSKWAGGRWTYIAPEKLVRIIHHATPNRQKRVNLMIAYLVDMTPEEYRPWIDIAPRMGGEPQNQGVTGKQWSRALRSKIEAIGDAYARDQDFMRMADNLGTWAATINKREGDKKG